jgi:hypothetical protein
MKHKIGSCVLAAAALAFVGCGGGKVVVANPSATTPAVVVAPATPASPGSDYVWVQGYYNWDGSRYEWVPGAWVRTPRPSAVWVPAHWQPTTGGYVWVPGAWR